MTPPASPGSRDPEQWIGAAAISAILLIGGAFLVFKGVRGVEEGAVRVTSGSMKAGPLSPTQAIVGGACAFALGLYVGQLARRKKHEIDRR